MENSTFISQVITNMASNKNRTGKLAKIVDRQNHELAANRVAMAWDNLAKQRKAANIDAVRSGVPAKEMAVKPEHFLSFIQNVMNASCWSARRVIKSGQQTDLANGLDFSQSVAEQAGQLESARIKDVECTLMDDFAILNELHSWLCSRMNYMSDLDPLFLFAEKEEVSEGVWEHTKMLMDFNDVLATLDEKALELAEQADTKTTVHAAEHVFGAKAKPKAAEKNAA